MFVQRLLSLSRVKPEVKIEEKGWLFAFSSSQSLFTLRREIISQLISFSLRSSQLNTNSLLISKIPSLFSKSEFKLHFFIGVMTYTAANIYKNLKIRKLFINVITFFISCANTDSPRNGVKRRERKSNKAKGH